MYCTRKARGLFGDATRPVIPNVIPCPCWLDTRLFIFNVLKIFLKKFKFVCIFYFRLNFFRYFRYTDITINLKNNILKKPLLNF